MSTVSPGQPSHDSVTSTAGSGEISPRVIGAPVAAVHLSKRSPASSADLILVVANTLWALNYAVVKFGLTEIDPLVFPVLRFGMAGLTMAAILRWREGTLRFARSDLRLLLATAILGVTLNQVFFVYSLTNTGASDVALLGSIGPLLTASLATAVGLERLGRRHWLGALAGMLGVVMIVRGGANASAGHSSLVGDGLALGATITASVSALVLRSLMQRYSAWRVLTFQMLVGSVLLFPFAVPALASQDYAKVTFGGWSCLAYTVVLAGIVTNLLYFTGIKRVGPSRTAMFGYLQSFLGALFAVVLLGERITALQLGGGAIVIGSIVLSRSRFGSSGR
jgi:drug/metabolite transporter (DMT)-like permease